MEIHTFFLYLLVILLTARLFAEIASRLQTPPVIGEILAGVLLGPSLLGWIEPLDVIRLLAEIGIILLLFEVGLETDIRQLAKTGMKAVVVALPGFFLPLLLGFSLAFWVFELPLLVSLFIGGTMTATSIGITVRVLADLKRQHSSEGQIVLGAAVLDDILGVVLLALLYEYSIGGGVSVVNTSKVLNVSMMLVKFLGLLRRRWSHWYFFSPGSHMQLVHPNCLVDLRPDWHCRVDFFSHWELH